MKRKKFPLFFRVASAMIFIYFSSCHQTAAPNSSLETERTKPLLTVLPIVDQSESFLPWDLSEELTEAIYHKLAQKNKVKLFDFAKTKHLQKKIEKEYAPFGYDISWCKKVFKEHEFIAFMRLIEHSQKKGAGKKNSKWEQGREMSICLQLRVIDVRGETPKIVLQEVIEQNHAIPKQFSTNDLHPKNQNFNISPLGLAHAQLTGQVAARIEDYILLSKNR